MARFDLELRVLLALAVVNGIAESSVVPLLPSIQDDLGLSSVEAGLVWTITTLAMLVAAVPVGYAANRLGSRLPLLVAAALMPLALFGQALAGGLGTLLAARLLFGFSFGILWVIGPARAAAGGRGARGIGPLIAAAGVGWLVGPVLAERSPTRRLAPRLGDARGPRRCPSCRSSTATPRPARRRAGREAAREGGLRARPAEPDDRGRRARERAARHRRGRVERPRASRPRRRGPLRRDDRARVRHRLRGVDRVGDARRPAARLLGSSARCRGHRRRHGRHVAAARAAADGPRARRIPRRLDCLPGARERAQLRRRRAREPGRHRADHGRSAQPRLGRDGAPLADPRGCRGGSSSVRLAFAATGLVAAVVALVLLGPRPRVRIDVLPS